MKHIKKQIALFAAGAACLSGIRMPLIKQPESADTFSSVCEFAQTVMQQMTPDPDCAFTELTFSEQEGTLLLDGKRVDTEAAGFRVIGGKLAADAEALGIPAAAGETVTLEQASELAGCDVRQHDGCMTVSSPFQSGVLLVKADGDFDTYGAVSVSPAYNGLSVLQYASPAASYQAYQALSADKNVQFAEPNRTVCAADYSVDPAAVGWGYDAVGADVFQRDYLQDSDTKVKVAVIDTGIYAAHQWFAGRIADGSISFCTENGGTPDDLHSHGTHCAGVICASTTPNVSILPIKALASDGYGSVLSIYCALLYAAEQEADIVSMSFNGLGYSLLVAEAAETLAQKDIACIVSAGNDSDDAKYYEPANLDSVVAVSALRMQTAADDTGYYELAPFSNYGESVDFCAPGYTIESAGITAPDALMKKSGTSMAAPFVSACYANILQYDSTLSSSQIYGLLKQNACDLGEAGFDPEYGWGMVCLRDFTFEGNCCAMPEIQPAAGNYQEPQQITLSCETAGAQIYYTTDGSTPTAENGILYQGTPVTIARDTLLKAAAFCNEGGSAILHAEYRIECVPPEFSLAAGCYPSAVSVGITAQDGAEIYYTTDGSAPTPETGRLYDGNAVELPSTALLRAIAVNGESISTDTSADYVIGNQNYSPLFTVQDGVLTGYSGSMKELDLTEMLPDTALSAIGDSAFAGNRTLEQIVLPDSVRTVGKSAFADCTALKSLRADGVITVSDAAFRRCSALSDLQIDWKNVTEIGAYAFAETAVSGDLQLNSLMQLGEGAFAETAALYGVWLPETITALPDDVFRNSAAAEISAGAVTVIGSGAFAQESCSCLQKLVLPFASLKAVGANAFTHCSLRDAGVPDPEFSSLKSVGAGAFAFADCNTMTFSALSAVPSGAFSELSAVMLYLPAAETIGSNAISFAESGKTGLAVGEKLKKIAENAITEPEKAAVYASVSDSPLRAVADSAGADYLVTPAVYVPARTYRFALGWDAEIAAYPLGRDVSLQWTKDGKTVSSKGMFAVCADTFEESVCEYTVCAVQNGKAVGEAVPVQAEVSAPALTGTVNTVNQPVPEQWPAHDKAQIRFAEYRFTAETGADYFIFSETAGTEVNLRTENGSMRQTGCGETPELLRPVHLQAGETVEILLTQTGAGSFVCAAVCDAKPVQTVSDGSVGSPDTAVFPLNGAYTLPVYPMTTESGVKLTAGSDYLQYELFSENGLSGIVIGCGIGEYCGICTQELVLYEELQEDTPVAPEHLQSDVCWYRFIPEQSGRYTFYIDAEDDILADSEAFALLHEQLTLTVHWSSMRQMKPLGGIQEQGLPQFTAEMTGGKAYYIALRPNGIVLPPLTLNAVQERSNDNLLCADVQLPAETEYAFAPCEPECIVSSANGLRMREDADYSVILLHNSLPGEMTVLLHGIGDRYGTALLRHSVTAPSETPLETAVTPDSRIVHSGGAGCFCFSLQQPSVLRLTSENSVPEYVIGQKNPDGSFTDVCRSDQTDDDAAFSLEAGDYQLLLYSKQACCFMLRTVRQMQDIGAAWIQPEQLSANGSLLRPVLRVIMDGVLLQEGTDYLLQWATPIRDAGRYEAIVSGCGDYAGTKNISFFVQPQPQPEIQEAVTGENTVAVTTDQPEILLCWIPQQTHYCIRKTDIRNTVITVYDRYGNTAAVCGGIGYQFAECNVRIGETYYISVSFYAAGYTGTTAFSLLSDYRLLEDSEINLPEMLPVSADGTLPALQLTDDSYVMQEGTDYIVRAAGDLNECGRVQVLIDGCGRYVGEGFLELYQYPEFADVLKETDAAELPPDTVKQEARGLPGSRLLYHFTADVTGRFFLHIPTSAEKGVCTF
ncbi:MAG: chitobiase/beta-hexosaminidase C-terminal domain-containing protein, partial [Oscillospiraceae bacterium]|nr:chitobiase/beta-hexosaminidase C-terminal domain-containing protein [Oscillospiraceae bacterium]